MSSAGPWRKVIHCSRFWMTTSSWSLLSFFLQVQGMCQASFRVVTMFKSIVSKLVVISLESCFIILLLITNTSEKPSKFCWKNLSRDTCVSWSSFNIQTLAFITDQFKKFLLLKCGSALAHWTSLFMTLADVLTQQKFYWPLE